MVALDKFWRKNALAARSITIEVAAAIFVSALLTSLLITFRVSIACTTFTASELWQIILSVSAIPAILMGLIIAVRIRQTLMQIEIAHEELVNLAWTDGLTGLLNRTGFDAAGAQVFVETRRSGRPISALVCEIDAFQGLNERYGYEAGDLALRNLAQAVEESMGSRCALVGRQGGDEFLILLPGIDFEEAFAIAESLREICEARALVQQNPAAKFTLSVGVETEASSASEFGGLLRRADGALYRAKRAGGNQVASGRTLLVPTEGLPIRSAKCLYPPTTRLVAED